MKYKENAVYITEAGVALKYSGHKWRIGSRIVYDMIVMRTVSPELTSHEPIVVGQVVRHHIDGECRRSWIDGLRIVREVLP